MSRIGPIRTEIPGLESLGFESIPDAVAACRRYFMAGGREPCRVYQDHLIYTIEVDANWNGRGLP